MIADGAVRRADLAPLGPIRLRLLADPALLQRS